VVAENNNTEPVVQNPNPENTPVHKSNAYAQLGMPQHSPFFTTVAGSNDKALYASLGLFDLVLIVGL
jgi:hypothetical protein